MDFIESFRSTIDKEFETWKNKIDEQIQHNIMSLVKGESLYDYSDIPNLDDIDKQGFDIEDFIKTFIEGEFIVFCDVQTVECKRRAREYSTKWTITALTNYGRLLIREKCDGYLMKPNKDIRENNNFWIPKDYLYIISFMNSNTEAQFSCESGKKIRSRDLTSLKIQSMVKQIKENPYNGRYNMDKIESRVGELYEKNREFIDDEKEKIDNICGLFIEHIEEAFEILSQQKERLIIIKTSIKDKNDEIKRERLKIREEMYALETKKRQVQYMLEDIKVKEMELEMKRDEFREQIIDNIDIEDLLK